MAIFRFCLFMVAFALVGCATPIDQQPSISSAESEALLKACGNDALCRELQLAVLVINSNLDDNGNRSIKALPSSATRTTLSLNAQFRTPALDELVRSEPNAKKDVSDIILASYCDDQDGSPILDLGGSIVMSLFYSTGELFHRQRIENC
ncbi:MAG: hypothetical protein AAGJ34_09250 [Pseudomonadota bacterium]